MAASYNDLISHFPKKNIDTSALFDKLGGEWPSLKDDVRYENTCTIRISHALNESGNPVPRKYQQAIDGASRSIIINVSKFNEYMIETYGESTWGISKQQKADFPLSDIPSEYKGIIVYHAKFAHATGHFDIWTGSEFLGLGNRGDIAKGFDIQLWNID